MTEVVDWPGKSGATYRYFFGDIKLCYAVPGNYAFVKKLPDGTYTPLYFGQAGDLKQRCADNEHEKLALAIQRGATHFMSHKSSASEDVRCAEERDLIARWNPPLNIQHKTVLTG